MQKTPTMQLFSSLQLAFTHFNKQLFKKDRLPEALITVARRRGAHGYHWAGIFRENVIDVTHNAVQLPLLEPKRTLSEICLNPDSMSRELPEVLSTLVHEMAHHWQHSFGKPGKEGYHNKQWVEKMQEIGLEPLSSNGKGTGKKVTHEIVKGGAFDEAFKKLDKVKLEWASVPILREAKPPTRHRLVCPECDQKIWGTDKNNIKCGDCDVPMEKEE